MDLGCFFGLFNVYRQLSTYILCKVQYLEQLRVLGAGCAGLLAVDRHIWVPVCRWARVPGWWCGVVVVYIRCNSKGLAWAGCVPGVG